MFNAPKKIYKENPVSLVDTYLLDDRKRQLLKKTEHNYLIDVVKYLCDQHGFKLGFIGSYNEESKKVIREACYGCKDDANGFVYDVHDTVCDQVIGGEFLVFLDKVQELFPKDKTLKRHSIKSYVGVPLFSLNRSPLGIIALMGDLPLVSSENVIKDLELFLSKTEQELGRILLDEPIVMPYKDFIQVFENSNDVFFNVQYDKNNEQIDLILSPSGKRMFEYSENEIKSLNFHELFFVSEERDLFLRFIKEGEPLKNYPLTLKKKNGTIIYVQIDCEFLVHNLAQNVDFSIRGIIKDVTQQYKENLRTEIAYVIARKSERRLTNIKTLVEFIRVILSEVVDLSSFYVGLHDVEKNELYLPAFYDQESKRMGVEFRIPFENSITEHIIKSNRSLITDRNGLLELIGEKSILIRGKLPESFVGMPLKSEGKCCGVMVMQSYKKDHQYTKEDIDLFQFIVTQVSYVVERTLWQDILIKKEEHYRLLIENSSEIFGIVSERGIIEYVSESVKRITGYGTSDFIGRNFGEFLVEDSFELLLDSKRNTLRNQHELLTIITKDGKKKYLETSVNRDKRKIIFNAKDITSKIVAERKRDNSLKQVNDLRNALNYSSAIYFVDYKSFKIIDVNKQIISLSGYTKKELIGQSPLLFNSKKYNVNDWTETWNKVKSGKVWQGEKSYQNKDGSIYWVYETITPTIGLNGKISQFISIQFDITKQNATKRNLIREVIEAQDSERERFAMELHDGLGQVLLAAKMNLNVLSDSPGEFEGNSREILNNSINLLTDAVQEARSISHGLMSRVLNKFGLAYAIDEIISNVNSNNKIHFEFKHNIKDIRFGEELEMGLYRTLQELIKNIIKHSKAEKSFIKIIKKEKEISIDIIDDGIGIKKETIEKSKTGGIGLRNIQSRIEYLGGVFLIAENIKTGTRIKILITL
jgi:PAS domain S-box-containing protein